MAFSGSTLALPLATSSSVMAGTATLIPYGGLIPGLPLQQQRTLKKPQYSPTIVVLTHLPSFLCHSRNLRDWVHTVGGNARSISYSRDNRPREYHNSSTLLYLKHKSTHSIHPQEEQNNISSLEHPSEKEQEPTTVAIIRLSHSTGAFNLCRFWEQAKQRLIQQAHSSTFPSNTNSNTNSNDFHCPQMNAYLLVTTSSDQYTPLDPIGKEPEKEFLMEQVFPSMYGPMSNLVSTQISSSLPSSAMTLPILTTPENIPLEPVNTTYNTTDLVSSQEYSQMNDPSTSTSTLHSVEEAMITKLMETYTAIRLRQCSLDQAGISQGSNLTSLLPMGSSLDLDSHLVPSEDTTTDLDFREEPQEVAMTTNPAVTDTTNQPNNGKKLDAQKVAAAAGGVYDEEIDPLNAPAVLEAVSKFKKTLEERDVTVKKKRLEYVDRKLKDMLGPARERLLQVRKAEKEEEDRKRRLMEEALEEQRLRNMALAAGLPLPPTMLPPSTMLTSMVLPNTLLNAVPMPIPMPIPMSGTPMNESVMDSGKRGVSNLPSWMTKASSIQTTEVTGMTVDDESKKRKMLSYSDESDREVNLRRQRLDTTGLDASMSASGAGVGMAKTMSQIRADNQAADAAASFTSVSFTDEEILGELSSFPIIPSIEDIPLIRGFVTAQIVKYLGEEEPTMIDYVMSHLQNTRVEDRSTRALLEELRMVLEDDAQMFVVDLFRMLSSKDNRMVF